MSVFLIETLPSSVSGNLKTQLTGLHRLLSISEELESKNAFEQAEMILYAALSPCVAKKARKGEFVKCFDHFDLLHTAIN